MLYYEDAGLFQDHSQGLAQDQGLHHARFHPLMKGEFYYIRSAAIAEMHKYGFLKHNNPFDIVSL